MTLFLTLILLFAAIPLDAALWLAIWTLCYTRKAQAQVPPDGGFIDLADARIHYLDIGEGPAIVLVHGLGGQLRNFTYALAGQLAAHHRLLIIDRPGSGYSTWTGPTDWSLRAQARVVSQFIEALGLDRPLLVGHSLGGAVSLALAIEHPEAVSGLALLAPLTQPNTEVSDIFKALAIKSGLVRRLVANTLATPLSRRNRVATGRVVFGLELPPRDFDEKGGSALAARPTAFFAASSELVNLNPELTGMVARYPALSMPVGILYGRDDQILSPALQGEATAGQIPGCQLKVMPGGHMIPVTAPVAVAEWLRQQAGRGVSSPLGQG